MAVSPNLYSGTDAGAQNKTAFVEREKSGEVVKPAKSKRLARYWSEVERYKRATSSWHDEVRAIENLYLEQDRAMNASNRRFALLWSNVETMKPAVYAKLPLVECTRRYKDRDRKGRIAAELMERASNTVFELYGVNEVFEMVRDDRLLGGRGTNWVRYEATIERTEVEVDVPESPDPTLSLGAMAMESDQETADFEVIERLKDERVCVDYVHTFDFGHNTAQTWNDVWLVWRCVYKTRDEMRERFGDNVANSVPYNAKAPGSVSDRQGDTTTGAETAEEFCRVHEFWDKRARIVTWGVEGYQGGALDEGEPPISFSGFFPCPRPCYATKTSKSLIPRPDYIYYRDQAKEINDLTDKIGNMMQWLVVKAFVPSGPSRISDPVEEALRDNSNRELMVQVEDWSQFTERGGAQRLIDWLPLDMIIQAIQAAISARNQLIQDVFQITGISDILRGQTDPSETLGAQELKAQTGSRRLRNTRDEISRFCRDTARLVAEVIAEKFEPESIAQITGFTYVPTPQIQGIAPMAGMPQPVEMQEQGWSGDVGSTFGDDVIALLRDDKLRSYRVEIETDSTSQPNEAQEQQRRTEMLGAVGTFLDRAASMMQAAPELSPVAGEMLSFGVRSFRAGAPLEETIERQFAAIAQRAAQAAQSPAESPEQIKANAEAQAMQQKTQIQAESHAADMDKARQEMSQREAEHAAKMQQAQIQTQILILELKRKALEANAVEAGGPWEDIHTSMTPNQGS